MVPKVRRPEATKVSGVEFVMRILAWDLECSPHLVYTFGLWNQNIGINQIKEPSRVMCFAARWADKPKNSIEFFSDFHHGHEQMVHEAWTRLDDADALLSWNGPGFDTKQMNREFELLGLGPPSPVREIDLMKAAKKRFYFPSNKLDWVSQELGVGEKVKHEGMDLWLKCMAGDPAAWARFKRYNEQDVHLLVELHERLLPWLDGYPNTNLYDGTTDHCPRCGHPDLVKRGFRTTATGSYQRYMCQSCGSWSTSGKSVDRSDIRGL